MSCGTMGQGEKKSSSKRTRKTPLCVFTTLLSREADFCRSH